MTPTPTQPAASAAAQEDEPDALQSMRVQHSGSELYAYASAEHDAGYQFMGGMSELVAYVDAKTARVAALEAAVRAYKRAVDAPNGSGIIYSHEMVNIAEARDALFALVQP